MFLIIVVLLVVCVHSLVLYQIHLPKKKDKFEIRVSKHKSLIKGLYLFMVILALIFMLFYKKEIEISKLTGFMLFGITTISLLLVLVARYQLGVYHSPYPELLIGHKLVKTGLYKYLDHPMYYFETVAIISSTLMISHFFGYAILIVWFVTVFLKIRLENKMLKEKFGNEFMPITEKVKKLRITKPGRVVVSSPKNSTV